MRRGARRLGAGLAAVLAMVACAPQPTPDGPGPTVQVVHQETVLVGGWFSDADAALEAVLPGAGAAAGGHGEPAQYRLRGLDDNGQPLFELGFGEASLAAVPGQPLRRFLLPVSAGSAGAAGLAALELDGGDGLMVTRAATISKADLLAALTGGEAVRIAAMPGERVRVRWDVGPIVVLRLRDPATGSVLALDRDGEVIVAAPGGKLEVAISDGVRSAAGLFELP
ncbi:hypothetical protein [Thioalkalivibrio sp. XN8]|uniref:hypothetical protein n=1 Tax=Thioalkalivibrio sp. XN8 TaxID=2712863 RepID=UPI0013EB1D78|nr:hypothetical protein [Thioalkalivibrio sp. XN8]NGP53953.1 hypothetical protein [Thioalkalivibrio sp. XN8]